MMDQPLRYLFIVSREQPDLCDYLRHEFTEDREVEVITDRRVAQRRRQARPHAPDRRRADRRSPSTVEHDLRNLGFAIVKRSVEK